MKTAMNIVFMVVFIATAALIVWRWQVNGWSSLVWLMGIVLMSIIRGHYTRQTQDNAIDESHKTTLEQILLFGMMAAAFLPIVHLASGVFGFADYRLPDWAAGLGVVVLVSGLWLFRCSHADLGRNWSVTLELREDHGLITSGVYKHIRHPMYSALWLIALSQALLIHNWIAGPAMLLAFGAMYVLRVPREEAMMRERFGKKYDSYCKKTGRIWPRWS